jgi:hypothetical protein
MSAYSHVDADDAYSSAPTSRPSAHDDYSYTPDYHYGGRSKYGSYDLNPSGGKASRWARIPQSKTTKDDAWKVLPTSHDWLMALYAVLMLGAFITVLSTTNSGAVEHTWAHLQWEVDGFQEFSERYDIVTIVLPLALGLAALLYTVVFLSQAVKNHVLYNYFRDGVSYTHVIDCAMNGIPVIWIAASMCGLTNLTELLLVSSVYTTGYILMAVAEYYAYNERMTLGGSGDGRLTWVAGFLTHAILFVLLPLDYKHGVRHHSTGALMVLIFTLLHLFVDHIAAAFLVFHHPSNGIVEDIEDFLTQKGLQASAFDSTKGRINDAARQSASCIVRGGDTQLFRSGKAPKTGVDQWKKYMAILGHWDCIRLAVAMACRLGITVAILSGKVFVLKSQVVY